jgi:hypothetical protein
MEEGLRAGPSRGVVLLVRKLCEVMVFEMEEGEGDVLGYATYPFSSVILPSSRGSV